MNLSDKPFYKVKPEIKELAGTIATVKPETKTPLQKDLVKDLWDSIVKFSSGTDLYETGSSKISGLKDKLLDSTFDDITSLMEKGTINIVLILAALIAPLSIITATAGYEAEALVLRGVRKKFRPIMLGLGQLQELYKRHPETETELRELISQIGYTDDDITKLLELTVQKMSFSEILGLLSREAFNETFAKKYGLDNGLAETLALVGDKIRTSGADINNFKYFYRAHWAEIPLNLLQIMHQRGQLTETELTDLLKAHTFPDYFIPKVKQALFTYPSKLDIRRMYNEGLIASKSDLIKELEKTGFSHEAAEAEAELYDVLKHKEKIMQPHLRQKGEGNILHAYSVQLISKRETKDMLMTLGYDEDDADFIISDADYDNQWAVTKMHLDAYHRAYINGVYDDKQLIAALGHLNLPAGYYETILDTWNLEIHHAKIKTERPSRAEILKWFANGLLLEADARAELKTSGLSDKYVNLYVEQTKLDMIKNKGAKNATAAT